MAVFVDSFDISNARVYCWALYFLCSIRTSQTHEEIQEGEMEYMTIHGRFTRDELMDMEGWSDYDMMDYKREWNHNLSFSGNLNPTPKWKLNYKA